MAPSNYFKHTNEVYNRVQETVVTYFKLLSTKTSEATKTLSHIHGWPSEDSKPEIFEFAS